MDSGGTEKRTLGEDLRALFLCPRELWLVYGATIFEYVGVFSFIVTLPLWLSHDYGMSDQRAGWWAATFAMLISLYAFVVGAAADVLGMRRSLVLSFALCAVTRLAMGLATSPGVALGGLMVFALAYAASTPVLQASVNRYSTKQTRSIAYSLWYVALNIGGAAAGWVVDLTRAPFLDPETHQLVTRTIALPLLGPTSMSAYRAIMGVGTLSAIAAFLCTFFIRGHVERERADEQAQALAQATGKVATRNPFTLLREVVGERGFWRFMLLLLLLAVVKMMFQHMQFTWPKYIVREQGEEFPWGRVWALNSVLILGFAPLAAALTRHAPALKMMTIGTFITAAAPFILCFGSSYALQVAMVVVFTAGEALWSPRAYEYTIAIAPPGRESSYAGLASLPWFVAKFFVGPASGYLLAAYCPESGPRHSAVLWACVGGMTMVGPVGILALRRVIAGSASPSPGATLPASP